MTDAATPAPAAPSGEHCPHCGAVLLTGTVDLAATPDTTEEVDLARAELRPGQMVQSSICPTPDCPGPDTGAQL
jgi:hypothetical protein